jgi:regulator of protease activity HflC (stomatin/prohibitin superfamily)
VATKIASRPRPGALLASLGVVGFVLLSIFLSGIRAVRPTGRGLVERMGRYRRMAMPGVNWILPGIERMFLVNVTEVIVNAEPQEIITRDTLNATLSS